MPDWIAPRDPEGDASVPDGTRLYVREIALRAAVQLIAGSPTSSQWAHRTSLELAEAFEAWLVRPVEPTSGGGA